MKKASSELLLLDVNVLLALAWPNHQFHAPARRRLASRQQAWATCALTQLGFIRLSSNPAAVSPAKSPREAALLLRQMVADPVHVYLPRLPAPAETDGFEKVLGSGQVTDAYLLAVAQVHNACLLTFDHRLRLLAAAENEVELLGV